MDREKDEDAQKVRGLQKEVKQMETEAREAKRSGEGAWLPLQDHDLRPQPADQQLLTARLVLLENHQSTV